MKLSSTVLLFALLAMQHHATAQITIGSDKLPVAGDTFTSTPMDTTGVDEGTAGSNKVWDSSGLIPLGGFSISFQYLPASSTPYAQQFPNATLASLIVADGDSTYGYFSTSSNRLALHGSAGAQFRIQYADPEVQMPTPLTYNDQFTDQFSGETIGEDFVTRSAGSLTIINDSYGTLTLPGGRTVAAARVKFVRDSKDTIFFGGLPVFTSRSTRTSYEWFTQSGKFPVLQIAYIEQVSETGASTSKLVEYSGEQSTSVKDGKQEGVASSLKLEQNFPNPFNPSTTIGFQIPQAAKVSLKVFNLVGQEVATLVDEELGSGIYAIPFEANTLATGTYLYSLRVGNSVQTKKLTLVK